MVDFNGSRPKPEVTVTKPTYPPTFARPKDSTTAPPLNR